MRVLARDPDLARGRFDGGVEIFPGDLTDLDALEQAMAGCDGVHISVGGSVDQASAQNVAALAEKLRVQRITYISGSTVDERN